MIVGYNAWRPEVHVIRLTIALSILTLLVAGCSASAHVAIPSPTAVPSGILRWGVTGMSDVPTLDPALVSDPTSISLASLVYGGLVRLDAQLHVVPDGAKRWTISRDGKTYTFILRRNLRFPNGRRVTAADFATALHRAQAPETSSGPASFYLGLIRQSHVPRQMSGIEAVSPTTLRITLARPAAHFLAQLAFPVSYVPDPTLIGRFGANWTDHAAGFGPFY